MALLLRLTKRPIRERRWGDETVVFDTYSGETHHLTSLASAMFRRVAAVQPVEFDAICAEFVGVENGAIEPEEIGRAAARLCSTGLLWMEESEA